MGYVKRVCQSGWRGEGQQRRVSSAARCRKQMREAFNNHGEGEGTWCGEYGRIGFGKHLLRHNGGAGEQHQKSIQQTGHERKVYKTP